MRDTASGLGCAVLARASFHSMVAQLDGHRQVPSILGRPISATFLRHSDEQTVASVAALNQMESALAGVDFHDWAVLACSRHTGRAAVAANLARYRVEGAWAASPHIVPHRCLHSPSGTLSLALKSEGPNFGVGEPDVALSLALAWLSQGRVPGVLVALAYIDPELPPDPETPSAHPESVVHAHVLALLPETADAPLRLRIRPDGANPRSPRDFADLDAWLSGRSAGVWPLSGGLILERFETSARTYSRPGSHANRLQGVSA